MREDQKISQEIVKLMWSIMSHEAVKFEFYSKIYNSYDENRAVFFNNKNEQFYFEFDEMPVEIFDQIVKLARQLRTLPPYKKEPWTHFKVTLHDDGKFNFDFAYIPEEKDELGIYMKEGNPAPYPPQEN